MSGKIKIAIPVGDPAGIGPEIALKAALDPAVRAACHPIIVCDPELLARHARACGIEAPPMQTVDVLACPQPEAASLPFGVVSPISGRASIAFCAAAVKAAMAGEVDAVVAAPQHETSIAQAGIPFDGHPSFVARQTGADENGVYMMLCFGDTRIVHCTLHRSVREAIALITRENVARTIRATDVALQAARRRATRRSPSAASTRMPAKADCSARRKSRSSSRRWNRLVGGDLRCRPVRRRHHVPHAGVRRVRRHAARPGPHRDQAARAERRRGADHRHADPVCSVAHGTGHDIAGKGIANPAAMIEAVLRLSRAKRPATEPAHAMT